jgi:regulator of protease activity HflC (stomatin/prohibitin superfamily)
MGLLLILLGTLVFPPILLWGFFVISPREEIVILRFGKHVATVKEQGMRWMHPIGRELRRVSTRDTTLHIPVSTVVDKSGNPIQISAVVVYRVVDCIKATLDVEDHHKFIGDQASAVVKGVAATFPYESPDSDKPCLKKEDSIVSEALVRALQTAVMAAGIEVVSVKFNDLTYSPEIAQAMLMRQQALALIDARKTIVEGAVEIVRDAMERLTAAGFKLEAHQRDVLISNLLVVICSGENAQPVVQVGASPAQERK